MRPTRRPLWPRKTLRVDAVATLFLVLIASEALALGSAFVFNNGPKSSPTPLRRSACLSDGIDPSSPPMRRPFPVNSKGLTFGPTREGRTPDLIELSFREGPGGQKAYYSDCFVYGGMPMFDQEGRQIGTFNPLQWPDPDPDCDSEPDWSLLQSHVLPVLPNAELDTIAFATCHSDRPATVRWTSRHDPRDALAPFAAAGWIPFTVAQLAAYPEPGVIGYSRSMPGRTISAAWIPSAASYLAAVEHS